MATSGLYGAAFHDTIATGSIASADAVVPLVLDAYPDTDTVTDVGCGRGWWGAAFAARGCTVTGLDGAYVTDPVIPFTAADLTQPLPDDLPRVDLAICLEVAEHLPAERAAGLVADLTGLSDRILFSAAIPHQSGAGHVNLQWPAYWARLFRRHGYGCTDWLRWLIWDDPTIEPWYRQNIMIFDAATPTSTTPPGVVHPVIHNWGRR